MLAKLAYSLASTGSPALLAKQAPGVVVTAQSPAPIYPGDGAVVVTVAFENPWHAPLALRGLKLAHVTMGEMAPIAPPERLKTLPGPAWLDPAGVDLQPRQSVTGRLTFACSSKLEVSLPCALEVVPSIGRPARAGVLCVPIADLEKEAAKKAKDAAKPETKPIV